MLNYVWAILIFVSLIAGAWTGRLAEVTRAAFDMAAAGVEIAIGLVGVMTLWLGLMRIAEAGGLVRALARLLSPLSRRLFPNVPADHPALAAVFMNLSANWLGLSNAATPLGIKAMEELQKINPRGKSLSDDMVTFLAMNTATVTLVPATVIGIRVSLGSVGPQDIIAPTILASVCATVVAVAASKILARFALFRKEGA